MMEMVTGFIEKLYSMQSSFYPVSLRFNPGPQSAFYLDRYSIVWYDFTVCSIMFFLIFVSPIGPIG